MAQVVGAVRQKVEKAYAALDDLLDRLPEDQQKGLADHAKQHLRSALAYLIVLQELRRQESVQPEPALASAC